MESDNDSPSLEHDSNSADLCFRRRLQPSKLIADSACVLAPLALIGFAIAVIRLEGRTIQKKRWGEWQNAITVIASVFPILFAAVAGRLVYEVARWKLEKGTTMRSLEQLLGSRTVGGAIITHLSLCRLDLLGTFLLLLWVFSPLGSQSVLRMLESRHQLRSEPAEITYFGTHAQSKLGALIVATPNSYDGAQVIMTYLASMFNTLLLAPETTKTDTMDTWGNVKIPVLSLDSSTWQNVAWSSEPEKFTALVGLPITNVLEGNTTFSLESSYIDLQCYNFSKGEQLPEIGVKWSTSGNSDPQIMPNNTWSGANYSRDSVFGPTSWSVALNRFVDSHWSNIPTPGLQNSLVLFENETSLEAEPTRLLFQGRFSNAALQSAIGMTAYCDVKQRYVESRVTCSRTDKLAGQNCSVVAQRTSQNAHAPADVSLLSFPRIWGWITNWLPLASGRGLTRPDLVVQYLNDPRLTNIGLDVKSMFTHVDEAKFSRRLMQVLNTYVLLSQVYTSAPGGSNDMDVQRETSITVPVKTSHTREVYMVSWPWMALFLVSCTILFISGATSAVFANLAIGPEILGYASAVVRDSQFIAQSPDTGRMHGIDVSRKMGDQRVRYGYTRLMTAGQRLVGVGLKEEIKRI